MAKSSSNSDLCSRAIQIIEALLTSQRLTDTLIPRGNAPTSSSSASTSPRYGLEWDTFTTSVTWYKPAPSWGAWVARLTLSKLEKWKTLGIGEAIRASKYEMPINPSLLTSLLCFWSLAANTFSFLEGFMTSMVFDVFALLSLRPMGALAHPLMAVGIGLDEDILNGFLACTSSKRVINYYLPIARCLANGVPVDMNSFLLGELYRAMFLLSTETKQSHGGPVWLIQMWAYSYFPSIAPELRLIIMPWSYGEAWMHARFPKEKGIPSFPTCFKLFSDSLRKRLPEEFMPFDAKKDLVVIKSTGAGVEAYCPSLVVRQFGLIPLLPVPPTWTKNMDWMAQAVISKDEAKQIRVLPWVSNVLAYRCWYRAHSKLFTNRVITYHAGLAEVAFDLRNQLMRCCQANLLQDAAFKKAKESVQSQAPLLMLPALSEQGIRTSTKRKSPEVEEVNPAISPKGAKPSGKKLIKTVAKKSTAKKAKVVEVIPDSSTIEMEPLDEDLGDTTTLSNLMRKVDEQKQVLSDIIEAQKALEAEDRSLAQKFKEAKKLAAVFKAKTQAEDAKKLAAAFEAKSQVEDAERKHLEAEEEKEKANQKRQQELERKKKEEEEKRKQEEEQKREEKKREVEAAKKKAEQVVPGVAKLTKPTVMAPVVSVQQVVQPTIEVRTLIEAATPSIEAAAPLAPRMQEGLGDIDKLLENVSLTLQQCQTPTKTSSTSISLEPSKDQLQAVIGRLKELLQKPVDLVLLDATLVDQFQQVPRFFTTHSSILSEGGKALLVKSLEAELQLWKYKRTQKCLELQTVHAESQGLVQGVNLISKAEQDIKTLQSEIADLEMLPLMSWASLSAAFKEL
uniref:Aminotransferase-like plant mobile domain-containing protein n=1 Tax=Fagus sylvatica TaxID=28930 RepID=A0A2N9H3S9_FAGSY